VLHNTALNSSQSSLSSSAQMTAIGEGPAASLSVEGHNMFVRLKQGKARQGKGYRQNLARRPKLPNLAESWIFSALTENPTEKNRLAEKCQKKPVVVAAEIFECEQGIPIISVSFLHDNIKFVL